VAHPTEDSGQTESHSETHSSESQSESHTGSLVESRAEELLRRAAGRAAEERYPVDSQFLRENDVTAMEMGEIMELLSTVLLGFCNAGHNLQTAVLISGVGGGDFSEAAILKAVMQNLQREELERLRSEFDARTDS